MAAGMAKQQSLTKATEKKNKKHKEEIFAKALSKKLERARVDAINKELETKRMEFEAEKREFEYWLA